MRTFLCLLITIGLLFSSCKKTDPVTENLSLNQTPAITDFDGNTYKTVTIGTQVWMGSNLRTTKYNDGKAIPLVEDDAAWENLSTHGYCWYNNEEATYKNTYGALYNFYTVYTGKLCPTGWHVPTYKEWEILVAHLGGEYIAGGKLKEQGTSHWQSPNTGATNVTDFAAVGSGVRNQFAMFGNIGQYCHFWGSVPPSPKYTYAWVVYYNDTRSFKEIYDWRDGFSVRCIKD